MRKRNWLRSSIWSVLAVGMSSLVVVAGCNGKNAGPGGSIGTAAASAGRSGKCTTPDESRRYIRTGKYPILATTLTVTGTANLSCSFDDSDLAEVSSCADVARFGPRGNGKFMLPFPHFHGAGGAGSLTYEIRVPRYHGPGDYSKASLEGLSIDYTPTLPEYYEPDDASQANVHVNPDGSGEFEFKYFRKKKDVFDTQEEAHKKVLSGTLTWRCKNPS